MNMKIKFPVVAQSSLAATADCLPEMIQVFSIHHLQDTFTLYTKCIQVCHVLQITGVQIITLKFTTII
jgi:hypothetical protein